MSINTMSDLIRTHGRTIGDKIAVKFEGKQWTYSDCDAESNQVARGLLSLGIKPGDRIAYLGKNTPEYFMLLFGGAKVGAVLVAVNWRLAPREMEYVLSDSEARFLLIGEEFLDHLAEIEERLTHIDKVVVTGKSGGRDSYSEWLAECEPVDPGMATEGSDVCFQLYTSGTTGFPKGVELTNDNMFGMLPTGSIEWNIHEKSTNLVCMPVFHIAGTGWAVVGFFAGATNVLTREIDPLEIVELINKEKLTVALFVPAVLQLLQVVPGVGEQAYPSLETIVYGASPITDEILVRSMETFHCDFIQVYGLTETTGAITILRPDDHDPGGPKKGLLRSAGRPWGDTEIRIVDNLGEKDLPDGEVGEIWIKSSQNMKGYWKQPEATQEAFPEDGWFASGDAGYLENGYLYIHDRVKDMIISGGENVYPAEVENVLMGHEEVADVAVIGVPDDRWGETVKAIVVREPDSEVTDRDLIDYCRELLAHYKCPTSVDWMDELPRTPSGKLLKTELREPYWEGEDRRVH